MSALQQADPGPSSGLIRRFSDKLSETSPSEPLSRGLASKVAFDRNRERSLQHEWDKLLLDGRELAERGVQDEEAVLFDQSRRLYSAWNQFQNSLPKDQRVRLGYHDRPDIKYLLETVSKASATWQIDREKTKPGKLKDKFSNLCETCKNHSTLLSVFPKDDKYVTLLTGSLSAIAQASINHQNIAEGVVDTLDELSQDIDFWNLQMAEHGNIPELRRYIQELYVVVFEWFTEIFIRWSKSGWKRFLTSFDEGAFNRLFRERRNRIMAIERRMERHVTLDFQHRTKVSMEKLVQSQEELLTSLPEKLDSQRRLLGSSLQLLLEQQKQWIPELPRPESPPALLQGSPMVISQGPTLESDPTPEKNQMRESHNRFNRADIQAELRAFIERLKDQMEQLIQSTHHASLQIDQHVYHQLRTWLKSSGSTSLWIQGPHSVPRPSQNSMTAVSIAALSGANDIPCISYFFSLTDLTNSKMSKSEALRMFLASLVTQLTKFIPENGYSRTSLEPPRFAALAQNNLTVDETLQLICDVREVGPRYVHGIIDNFQLLEDRSDTAFTRDLLKTIGMLCRLDYGSRVEDKCESNMEPATRTRMCFTTDGYMDGLAQATALELITKVEYDLEANDKVKEIAEVAHWDKDENDDL